jgi:hypothetical protein
VLILLAVGTFYILSGMRLNRTCTVQAELVTVSEKLEWVRGRMNKPIGVLIVHCLLQPHSV